MLDRLYGYRQSGYLVENRTVLIIDVIQHLLDILVQYYMHTLMVP